MLWCSRNEAAGSDPGLWSSPSHWCCLSVCSGPCEADSALSFLSMLKPPLCPPLSCLFFILLYYAVVCPPCLAAAIAPNLHFALQSQHPLPYSMPSPATFGMVGFHPWWHPSHCCHVSAASHVTASLLYATLTRWCWALECFAMWSHCGLTGKRHPITILIHSIAITTLSLTRNLHH